MQIGPYTVVEELGRGGMGVVYRARRGDLQRDFALKVIRGDAGDPEATERFRREAQAAAALSGHPGIVGVHDIGEAEGQLYFAMDCVEGKSLEAVIDAGDLDPRDAASYLEQAARAVQHAHSHGVLHRDLKPGNIMITDRGEARVTDFGLAKREQADSESARLTQSGIVIGTPHYMPPEQASPGTGRPALSPASDVYSLGATLYEALVSRPPFDGDTVLEVLSQLMRDEPKSPRTRDPRVPAALDVIVMKCLEKDPAHRYPSAGALADDLGRWLRDEPITARKPSAGRRVRRWIRTHTTAAIATVLLIAGAAASLGVWLGTRKEAAQQREQIDQLSAEKAAAIAAEAAAQHAAARSAEARSHLQTMQLLLRVPELDAPAVERAARAALEAAQAAIGHDAGLAPAYLARAEARVQLGLLEEAQADAARAIALDGGAPAARLHARIGLQRYLEVRGVPIPILARGVLVRVFQRPESPATAALRPRVPEDPAAVPPELVAALRLADGDPAGALAGFDAAIAAEPFNPLAYLYRAHTRLALLDVGQARRDYERARRLTPALAGAHHGVATCALFRGDADAAELALQAAPDDPVTARLRAQVVTLREGGREGAAVIGRAILRWPASVELRLWRVVIWTSRKDRTEAEDGLLTQDLDAVIAAEPDHWYARLLRAERRIAEHRFAEALEDLDVALRSRPTDALLHASRAAALMGLERWLDGARAHVAYHLGSGTVTEFQGERLARSEWQRTAQHLAALRAERPSDEDLRFLEAMARWHLRDPGAAAELEVLSRHREWGPLASEWRGTDLMRARRAREAAPFLAAAGRHPAIRRRAPALLAWAHEVAGRPDVALRVMEDARRLQPMTGPNNYNLAQRYRRYGDAHAAAELLVRTTYFYDESLAHVELAKLRVAGHVGAERWSDLTQRCARAHVLVSARAGVLMQVGRHEEALQALRQEGAVRSQQSARRTMWALVSSGRHREAIASAAGAVRACGGVREYEHEVYKAVARAHFLEGDVAAAADAMERAGAMRHRHGPCAAPGHARALRAMASKPEAEWTPLEVGTAAVMGVRGGDPERAAALARRLRLSGEQTGGALFAVAAIEAGSLLRLRRPGEARAVLRAVGYRPGASDVLDAIALTALRTDGAAESAVAAGLSLLRSDAVTAHVIGETTLALAETGRRFEAALQASRWLRLVLDTPPLWQLGGHLDPAAVRAAVWDGPATGHEGAAAHAVLALDEGRYDAARTLIEQALTALDALPDAAERAARAASLRALSARARAGLLVAAAGDRWRPEFPDWVPGPVPAVDAVLADLDAAWDGGWRNTRLLQDTHEFLALRRDARFNARCEDLARRPR